MAERDGILETLGDLFVPIHRDGQRYVGIGFVLTLLLFLLWSPLGWIGAILTGLVAAMFRDPDRVVPMREGLILAPADGKVEAIETLVPDAALDLGPDERVRVSIHLSLLDVHLTRAPVPGTIARTLYAPGTFGSVRADKASDENERRATIIDGGEIGRLAVVQIAGGIRRRIVSFVEEGGRVGAGERIGIIRFGSRVDIYLPPGLAPLVSHGQSMVGGETVVADRRMPEDERSTRVV